MKSLTATAPEMLSSVDEQLAPRIIRFLILLLSFYLAAPLWDLPVLGLSFSALFIFFLFFETFRHLGGLRLHRLGMLPWLLILLWFGQLISMSVNEIASDQTVNFSVGLATLLRYAFWFMVACLSARVFSSTNLPRVATYSFGVGCLLTAATLLVEHFLLGGLKQSGLSNITVLSQNSYGWQFSAFAPCAFYLVVALKGRIRIFAGIGVAALLLAVLLNGSRSSWGTVSFGLLLLSLLWMVSSRGVWNAIKTIALVGFALAIVTALFVVAPGSVKEKFLFKIERSQDLNRDKSWQIRLLMIQKGEQLFFDNMIFGVGPGQFRYRNAELDIPLVLSYESDEYFNKKSSHNSYIQLLAEGGLLLAIPFVIFLSWLLIDGFQSAIFLARHGESWYLPIYVGFICFSIHFWSIAGITSTAPWFLYGITAAGIFRARTLRNIFITKRHKVKYGATPRIPLSYPG